MIVLRCQVQDVAAEDGLVGQNGACNGVAHPSHLCGLFIGGLRRQRDWRHGHDDEGLAFGLGRRAYVFDAVDAGEMAPGWHFFHAGLPPQNAVAVYRSNFGLNIYREVDRVGVTLGLRSGATLAAIPSDQTAVIDIDFEPNAPELTRLRYCFGEAACDSFFSDR
jgi:hypothetical protein